MENERVLTEKDIEKGNEELKKIGITLESIKGFSNVGFSKIKYLSMYFKKWYGCTPSQYRRMNKNRIDKTEKNNK